MDNNRLLEEALKAKTEAIEQLCTLDKKVAALTAQLEAANSKGTCTFTSCPPTQPAASAYSSAASLPNSIKDIQLLKPCAFISPSSKTLWNTSLRKQSSAALTPNSKYDVTNTSDQSISDAELSDHDVTISPGIKLRVTSTPNEMHASIVDSPDTVRRNFKDQKVTNEKLSEFIMSRKRGRHPLPAIQNIRESYIPQGRSKENLSTFRFKPQNETIQAGPNNVSRTPRLSEMPSFNYSTFTPTACSSMQVIEEQKSDVNTHENDTIPEKATFSRVSSKSRWSKFGKTLLSKNKVSDSDKFLHKTSGAVVKQTKSSRLRVQGKMSQVAKEIKSSLRNKTSTLSMSNLGIKTRSMKSIQSSSRV